MFGFNILVNVEFALCKCFISKMPVIALKVLHEAFLNQPRLYIFPYFFMSLYSFAVLFQYIKNVIIDSNTKYSSLQSEN